MFIRHNPNEYVTETTRQVCHFHKKHPSIRNYPGCTCSMIISYRRATSEEQEANRKMREARREELIKANKEFGWPPIEFANLMAKR